MSAPERIAVEIETARALSLALATEEVAWVYMLIRAEGDEVLYITRFGADPETTMPNDPRAQLILVAGFRDGLCIRTEAPEFVEIEAGQCAFCGGDLVSRYGGRSCFDCGEVFF